MPLFRKDFSIFSTREKRIQVPPQYAAPSTTIVVPPTPHQLPPPPPQPSKRPEITYHSTLFLLDKLGLAQEPIGYWDGKIVEEIPSSRNSKGRPVFDPETRARRAQQLLARDANARKAEMEARSQAEGWLEGRAPHVARALEEIEDTRCEIRDVGRWENIYLTVREERKAPSRASWFGKESDDERRCRMAVDAGKHGIRGPEYARFHPLRSTDTDRRRWTREYEPQSSAQLASSAASIRSQKSHRRTTSSSSFTAASLSPSDTRNSILSTTTRSTPRSSIMSTAQSVSTVSSPISSGMPSPTLSTSSGKGGSMWKDTENAHRLSLPPPVAL
ncbi:hypothetical protein K440DRAFT_71421 [Wilcoxina mikolae CBS 423.85]|nr:hypothetical protein K440DRAFT_71421 [Wilcoxina mikolae CBS 423.85]